MSTSQADPDLTTALLKALEIEDDHVLRVRGEEAARPSYLLRELPVPPATGALRGVAQGGAAASSAQVATAPPAVACPHCGHENAADARFCKECGADLRGAHARAEALRSQPTAERRAATARVTLVSINEDGKDGQHIRLEFADTIVGRGGDVRFPTDTFLSPKHARVTTDGDRVFLEDLYSLNGTYVKLREEVKLTPGDTFLMGRQVLRFERFEHEIAPRARSSDGTRYMGSPPPGGLYKLLQIGIGGIVQNVHCLPEAGAVIGREKGDVIFPRDKFMSSRHAQVFPREDGHYYLVDLQSSNGTWVKIWERKQLGPGDFIFLGQQLFRVEFD
ncbi:MAG: FHA domain-containing protein [Deltaproteobacteria bacterium]|nr:MAG: FHA domain-containing protein [Deltaproteobacteria bacterium]